MDKATGPMSARAEVVLKGPRGIKLEYALKIHFKASNNAVEYGVMIADLNLAKEIKPKMLIIYSDSQLVINQMEGQFTEKDGDMLKYLIVATRVVDLVLEQIPRESNQEVYALSKMAYEG